jgi:hypothetical protein
MLTNDYKLKFSDWQDTLRESEPVFFGTKHKYIGGEECQEKKESSFLKTSTKKNSINY